MQHKTRYIVIVLAMLLASLAGGVPAGAGAAAGAAEPAATATAAAAEETAAPVPSGDPNKLIIATTTSTADSGLLDVLLPAFEQEFGVDTDYVAVGTGQSLKLGEDCNADVVLVHARAREDEFMNNGFGSRREDVMYNDFVIVGPASDPAGIKGMTDAAEAFKAIAAAEATVYLARRRFGHAHQGTGDLEEGRDRAERQLVRLGRAGHGRRAQHGQRAAGLHAQRPGHLPGAQQGRVGSARSWSRATRRCSTRTA